jgi:hypothetical protein
MKRKIIIFTLVFATGFLAFPAESYAATGRSNERTAIAEYSGTQVWRTDRRRRGRGKHRGWKNTYGYRNYGQYRRTQVGNRRYRLVRRPYWNGGVRRVRLVRVYY